MQNLIPGRWAEWKGAASPTEAPRRPPVWLLKQSLLSPCQNFWFHRSVVRQKTGISTETQVLCVLPVWGPHSRNCPPMVLNFSRPSASLAVLVKTVDSRELTFRVWIGSDLFFNQTRDNSDSGGLHVCLKSLVLENAGVLVFENSGEPTWLLPLSVLECLVYFSIRAGVLGRVSFYS